MFKRLIPILFSLFISNVTYAEEITGDVTGNVIRSIKSMGFILMMQLVIYRLMKLLVLTVNAKVKAFAD
jgi:hypothetical protein